MPPSTLTPSSSTVLFPHPLPISSSNSARRRRISRRRSICFASASGNPNGSDGLSWARLARSISRSSERLMSALGETLKKETGIDIDDVNKRILDAVDKWRSESHRFRLELVPEFIRWNRWEYWKDIGSWEPKRVGALALYMIAFVVTCWRTQMAFEASRTWLARKEVTEAYMDALIPEPTPANVRKLKKGIWRKTMPKGLKMKKHIEGPDGTIIHDTSYVGEDAWDDDDVDHPLENLIEISQSENSLTAEEKKAVVGELGVAGQEVKSTWRERLHAWEKILRQEKVAEQLDSLTSRYVVEFDMKAIEDSLRKDVVEKASDSHGARALWISKRWWRYRPKLPYTYLLQKLDSSEVAAVVFTEDLKRLYVTMKEGFPLEYIVDIPLDPYLFETISNSGVEVDLLQKRQIHYFLRVVMALLPGIVILWLIREALMLTLIFTKRYVARYYDQLFDMAHSENLVLPSGESGETKSISREVILAGDVWDLLDELMTYMENPMRYLERGVKFVRGVLVSGPPGTGKTLFARTLAKKSGLPFVFASGAEFTEKNGAAKINELFLMARRHAPSFIFVDEIDAIAGRHVKRDKSRRSSFIALINQLDGEKEKIGYDQVSVRQAVIFICATNRPDELDPEFLRAGRIDRQLHIGLPNTEQRVQIFGVHSRGKKLAENVDFEKLVYRTVGYSGADIRNLINEAGIMTVRKGHSMITQQDIIDVLDKELLEGLGMLLTEEEQRKCELSVSIEKRRLLAVHEAGHIVLAHLFPRYDWHAFSQLLPGGKETAISVFYPREDIVGQGYTSFGYMMMQMVVAHGGQCAEKIVFGNDITDGGKDDLEKITKIAREMVISPRNARLGLTALTKRVGLAERPESSDGEVIRYKWDDPRVIPTNMSLEVSELFMRELARYIEETEELAMKGLQDNRHILDAVAVRLLEKSRITGLEVGEMMKGLSPIKFEDFVQPFQINMDEEGPLPHNEKLSYKQLDVYPAPLHRC